MQPFGLLNFLQTLINSSQQNPTASPTDSPQENAENTDVNSAENTEKPTIATDNQKAILSFFEAHEKRAKHIKK